METRSARKHNWLNQGRDLKLIVDTFWEPDEPPHFWGLQSGLKAFMFVKPVAQEHLRNEMTSGDFWDLGSNLYLTAMDSSSDNTLLTCEGRCAVFDYRDKYTAMDGGMHCLEVGSVMKTLCVLAEGKGIGLSEVPDQLMHITPLSSADLFDSVHILCGWHAAEGMPPPRVSVLDVVSRMKARGTVDIAKLPFACNTMAMANSQVEWEEGDIPKNLQDIVNFMFGGFHWNQTQ